MSEKKKKNTRKLAIKGPWAPERAHNGYAAVACQKIWSKFDSTKDTDFPISNPIDTIVQHSSCHKLALVV